VDGQCFHQRLWRSLKCEDIYLKGYADGREARAGIAAWIAFYNLQRPHQALENGTRMAAWRDGASGEIGRACGYGASRNAHALPEHPQPQQRQVLIT